MIWTRGSGDPDRRPEVRALFEANGFDEVAFDGAPERFGVGVSQLVARPERGDDAPLFSFVR